MIVGGLAAGPSAAAKAVRTNSNVEVTLFEASDTVSYGICEAPYAIGGVIEDENRLVLYTPQRLEEEKGVRVKTLHLVERIIPSQKKIVVRDLRRRITTEYQYDKLILATGSLPRKLNVDGEEGKNVFHINSRQDVTGILNYIKSEAPQNAVIIGGGYVGMEMAEALKLRNLNVTLLHPQRLPMLGLENSTREKVYEELKKNGINFVSNTKIEALYRNKDGIVQHVVTNRGTFQSDIVVLSLGVEPNIALAKTAKIRLGRTGAIATDEHQQTNVDSIYAAGDCCEVRNIVSGKPTYLPLATLASRAGWVAGINAAGGNATFKGAIRAIATKVFSLEVAQVGLGSDEAKQLGFRAVTETISAYSTAEIMPNSSKITITLNVDQQTKRVLGANLYGSNGVVLRANTLGVAIQYKSTVDDLGRLDMIYAPLFAPLWDPILVAANQANKKVK